MLSVPAQEKGLRCGHTRKSVIVAIGKLVVDKDGVGVIFVLETLSHTVQLILGHLEAGPAIPLEASRLAQARQASDQAPRRHGEAVATIFGTLDGDGETVGEEEQAAGARLGAVIDNGRHLGRS